MLLKHPLGREEGEQAKSNARFISFLDVLAGLSVELLVCLLAWLFCVCWNAYLQDELSFLETSIPGEGMVEASGIERRLHPCALQNWACLSHGFYTDLHSTSERFGKL